VRQYKRKISQWNLDKKVKGPEMEFIVHKGKKRKVEEGKETAFLVRKRPVAPAKIERTIKRKNMSENEILSPPSPAAGERVSSAVTGPC
jgi:hypothetical protein